MNTLLRHVETAASPVMRRLAPLLAPLLLALIAIFLIEYYDYVRARASASAWRAADVTVATAYDQRDQAEARYRDCKQCLTLTVKDKQNEIAAVVELATKAGVPLDPEAVTSLASR